MILPADKIRAIHKKAVSVGLHNKRNQMLFGLDVEYVATLDQAGSPSDQLLSDLAAMNKDGAIGGDIPLELWLRNAAYAMSIKPDEQRFFRELADQVASTLPNDTDTAQRYDTHEERILFVSELLPFGFLAGAARIGKSVARLTVPRFESAHQRTQPMSSDPILYYGTGWLIGPRHIITNYHVIKARGSWEAPPERPDLELQARSVEVQFDYDEDNITGETFAAVALSASNIKLDYAVLELAQETGRLPLPVWGQPIDFTDSLRLPVNIIQHPGGQAKQLAIRNNLAAGLRGSDLAYYTDTTAGSSGSPVCNDQWQVLAIHKTSTRAHGNFSYQGKETAWVNTGTIMKYIIDDLRSEYAEVWKSIHAVVV
jgi:endonuclease G